MSSPGEKLYEAAMIGDWKNAIVLIGNHPNLVTDRITISNDTALHIAAAEGHFKLVEILVNQMTSDQLRFQNIDGETALHGAVIAGNMESVKAMVEKNPGLIHIPDRYECIPLLNAANYASLKEQKKDIIKYLYSAMNENDLDPSHFSGNSGRRILCRVIGAGFHDIAKDMIDRYPKLATERDKTDHKGRNPCALEMMAASDAFLSRNRLQFWDRLVYSLHFPSNSPGIVSHQVDPENHQENPQETVGIISHQRDSENPQETASIISHQGDSENLQEGAAIISHHGEWKNPLFFFRTFVSLLFSNMYSLCTAFISVHFPSNMPGLVSHQGDSENSQEGSDTPGIISHQGDSENPQPTAGIISLLGDSEDPQKCSSFPFSTKRVFGWVTGVIRELAKQIVPGNKVRNKKSKHDKAVELTKLIIEKMNSEFGSSVELIEEFFRETRILDVATKLGAVEVVKECLQSFPGLHWVKMGEEKRDMFYSAVCARQVKIFNLIHKNPGFRKKLAASVDSQGSTILHMVASTPNEYPSSVNCIALRLQRDLQWFKEVESLVTPAHRIIRNNDNKTAQELFKENNISSFIQGEIWIKGTANSCALVSVLIATVVFAAAFTVPGGFLSDDIEKTGEKKGNPIFLNKTSFMVFAVANASALFSSTSSLLIFVALMTFQYHHADFLESIPKRLMIGFITLFISIISMMVAFCATLFIVLGPRLYWLPILLSGAAAVPILFFVWSHILLFVTMLCRTYGRSIFRT